MFWQKKHWQIGYFPQHYEGLKIGDQSSVCFIRVFSVNSVFVLIVYKGNCSKMDFRTYITLSPTYYKVTFSSILILLAVSKDATKQLYKETILLMLTLFCNNTCTKENQGKTKC